jgi:preprotein translocase subunit YajC
MDPVFLMAPPAEGQGGAGSLITALFPFLLIFLIFYLLVFRPHSKRQKETAKMIAALKQGDRVLTSGGIYGTVVSIKEDNIAVLKIADSVRIEVAKSAISSVVQKSREA